MAGALLATLGLSLLPIAPAAASVPVVVLDGTGWGHGVGLPQWGAAHLASAGASSSQILDRFYPGTELAEATGPVRVVVHRPSPATTTVSFPQGGEVRSALDGPQAPGFPVAVPPGGRVRVSFDGAYRVEPLAAGQAARATAYRGEPCTLLVLCPPTTEEEPPPTTSTTAPPPEDGGGGGGGDPGSPPPGPPPSSPPPAGASVAGAPVWAVPAAGGATTVDDRGRTYRGVLQATAEGGFRLVNHIDVEDYLRGMAEVPGTWPAAAVQAQAVAARTYALRAMQGGGEMCDDARCQVYAGTGAASPGQDAAVAATARQVLVHGGALAAAVYSADAGGVTATTQEGFGTPDGVHPYLRPVRYDTPDPLPWHQPVALADVAARLGYGGTITDVAITEIGPSGRALQVRLDGSAGPVTVDGRRFARALGLRSTRFTADVDAAASAPAAPPAAEAIQELPDDAADAARRPLRPGAGARLERAADLRAGAVAADLPPALDPRRHAATVLAVLLVAFVTGALAPVGLVRRPVPVGASGRWRHLVQRG